jgi:hypothetical protein
METRMIGMQGIKKQRGTCMSFPYTINIHILLKKILPLVQSDTAQNKTERGRDKEIKRRTKVNLASQYQKQNNKTHRSRRIPKKAHYCGHHSAHQGDFTPDPLPFEVGGM